MMGVPSENVFYLDSNIIVAFYFEDDDAYQHDRILKCLDKLSSKNNIILIASTWTLIEADKAIYKKISNKVDEGKMNVRIGDYERKRAHKFITNLWGNPTFDVIGFNIKKFSMDYRNEDYLPIEDFFDLVANVAPLGNLRDALHCVITNYFGIKKILTFNISDFKIFEEAMGDIEAINPDDIDN
ncbi:MAG: type II toxin-antitoxin system VapC family toxin [Methanophagales archaeon]|nr:type II toxin-antitoxin system VapC family toxin [Methanophagales archaeon]